MKKKYLVWIILVLLSIIPLFFVVKQAMSTEEVLPGRIVFDTFRDPKTGDIAVLENGEIRTVEKIARDARWSKDGKKLLYISQAGRDHKLTVLDRSSSEKQYHDLSKLPTVGPFHPTWFDSEKIIFVGYDKKDKKNLKDDLPIIYIFDLQREEFKKISDLDFAQGRTILDMDVSLVGKKIAIADSILYLGNFENDRVTDLVKVGYAEHARFSSEGKRLVFSSIHNQNDGNLMKRKQIFVMDLETKRITQLTNNEWDNIDPCWSPDGKQILFVSGRYASSHTMGSELFVMDADGKNERQVTKAIRLGQMIGVGPLWSRDQNPDWAP